MRRLPAILGAAGLDFGLKPAIAYALRPKKRWLMNQDGGTDDAFGFCGTAPNTLTTTISGLMACGCVFETDVGLSQNYSNLIGINGSTGFSRSGATWYSGTMGSFDYQGFIGIECTASPGDVFTQEVAGFITCDPTGFFIIRIGSKGPGLPGPPADVSEIGIMIIAVSLPIGGSVAIQDCGPDPENPADTYPAIGGGSITLS